MNTAINDKLDLLIALAAKDCGNDDVEMFRSLDTSDVNLGNNFYAKQRRAINKYKRKPAITLIRKCLIRVAVALMAILSFGFMTVMAMPDLKEAVFEAVVEWYDNHISIRFEPSGGKNNEPTDTTTSTTTSSTSTTTSSTSTSSTSTTTSSTSTSTSSTPSGITGESDSSNSAITPPTRIEKVMKPTYIPEGAEEDLVTSNKIVVTIDYYIGDDVDLSFSQRLLDNNGVFFDDNVISYDIEVNGYSAVLLEFESGMKAIAWTDGAYYYYILSTISDVNELIKIASSVR